MCALVRTHTENKTNKQKLKKPKPLQSHLKTKLFSSAQVRAISYFSTECLFFSMFFFFLSLLHKAEVNILAIAHPGGTGANIVESPASSK